MVVKELVIQSSLVRTTYTSSSTVSIIPTNHDGPGHFCFVFYNGESADVPKCMDQSCLLPWFIVSATDDRQLGFRLVDC